VFSPQLHESKATAVSFSTRDTCNSRGVNCCSCSTIEQPQTILHRRKLSWQSISFIARAVRRLITVAVYRSTGSGPTVYLGSSANLDDAADEPFIMMTVQRRYLHASFCRQGAPQPPATATHCMRLPMYASYINADIRGLTASRSIGQ